MLYTIMLCVFFFKQKTAYEMRISDWSSDVCSSDLPDQSQFAARVTMNRRKSFKVPQTLPSPHRPLINAAAQGQHQRQRVVRDLVNAIVRNIRDFDAFLCSPPNGNGVYTYARTGNDLAPLHTIDHLDRKSVVSGKSVSVRVDLGGRRIIKKKRNTKK